MSWRDKRLSSEQDRRDMAALRNAPRDQARVDAAAKAFREWLEAKKAGKLPMYQKA